MRADGACYWQANGTRTVNISDRAVRMALMVVLVVALLAALMGLSQWNDDGRTALMTLVGGLVGAVVTAVVNNYRDDDES